MKKNHRAITVLLLTLLCFAAVAHSVSAQQEAGKEAFSIERLVVCSGIENREPVGAADTFPASTETVYVFLEATSIPEDTQVTFVWYHGDKELSSVTMPVKAGARWRTYASKRLAGLTGEWKVELKDAAGTALKSIAFKVE